MAESSVNSRFREYLHVRKINANKYAKELGYDRSEKIRRFANEEGYMVSGSVIIDISANDPTLNMRWLLNDSGEMFASDSAKPLDLLEESQEKFGRPDIYSELQRLSSEIEQLKKEVRSK